MSLFGEYIKERLGKQIIENDDGFMSYIFSRDFQECYIEDCYVRPEKRKLGIGREMLEQVRREAKSRGVKRLTTSVRPSSHGSTVSLKAVLAVGFELLSAQTDAIIFVQGVG